MSGDVTIEHFGPGSEVTEQAGFRGRFSTEDQALRLTQDISDALQETKLLRTLLLLALLDYSKAYDTVWPDCLLRVLSEIGVPIHFVRWVKGFLRNHLANVRWGTHLSKSVISSLLFVLYINGVGDVISQDLRYSLYADDLAVWCRDTSK